ncbi:MAG TPA: cell filamentation protein Fic [Blastocatellia bacterium]|nr:cell filamentation protein Fic [Blastocatellia bacterium]
MRSGQYIKQASGYRAFVPAPLPPDPPVAMDAELTRLLSEADRSLGRLDGIGSVLPNPNLFVAMYVRQEAVLSSQIEGTQSTLEDVLQFEVDAKGNDLPKDVEEVVNYVRAMNYGLLRLDELPLSLRLIREIHSELLEGVRGAHRAPGEFRRSQNWIGPAGATLETATFVPPSVPEMHQALDNFEKFLHDDSLPVLIQTGLAHAQFETIHPFLDGNGRVVRLLITLLLCQRKVLHQPLLYLSHYLKGHRAEYYDRLTAIRNDGNWEGWLKFFLRGVAEVSGEANKTARRIFALRDEHRVAINKEMGSSAGTGLRLLDYLYEQPMINVRMVERHLQSSFVTASKLVDQLVKLEILRETTGGQRNRRYAYSPYLALFESSAKRGEESKSSVQTTADRSSGL